MSQHDRLTKQLSHLPSIVGRMGLSIAEAQRELDLNFVESIRRLVLIFQNALETAGASPEAKAALLDVVKQMAPSRYQFTETTIEFSADLAKSIDVAAGGSVSAGLGVASISASVAAAYGVDHRAAARVRSVLHAYPMESETRELLLKRAQEVTGPDKLPDEAPAVDKELLEAMQDLGTQLSSGTTEEEEE